MDELEQLKNLWPDSVLAFNEMIEEKMVEYGLKSQKSDLKINMVAQK